MPTEQDEHDGMVRYNQLCCKNCQCDSFVVLHFDDEPLAWLVCDECESMCAKLMGILQPDDEVFEA